jgi:hypothetical protein
MRSICSATPGVRGSGRVEGDECWAHKVSIVQMRMPCREGLPWQGHRLSMTSRMIT